MEHSSALHKLIETADLIRMVEDLVTPGTLEKLSGQSLSGVRITLQNVRKEVLAAHDQLAAGFISKARGHEEGQSSTARPTADILTQGQRQIPSPEGVQITRNELRASVQKIVE